ncbi:MAG: alkaline phosphatase PhoX [Pyrinomonadaceae bacterium]
MDRRSFISNISAATGSIAFASSSLGKRALAYYETGNLSEYRSIGYGDLIPTASKNTGEKFLSLPKGFEYNVIGKKGALLSDGRLTPALHDGMHTFKVGRELRIVRNHEVTMGRVPRPGSAIGTANHYDETAPGGTTTLVIDPKTREIERSFVSLSGTINNCCGGPTPWGSWISCEETTVGPTLRKNPNGTTVGGFPKPHGYCFEVPASANNNIPAVPLKAMGRFTHEAIAVHKKTGIVYLTEDYEAAGFYRFLPNRNKRLAEGGTLQMLAIKDKPNYDTRTGQKQGTTFDATWVAIDNPDPAEADIDPSAVFKQGRAKGGATFARLEGCCSCDDGNIFFDATSGGNVKGGQIWRYTPTNKDGGKLTLTFESPNREVLDMPDNVCMMPHSPFLFICEDSDYLGEDGTAENFVRILTPDGRIADFARNIVPGMERGEFAGSTFSPDGKTLFFNIQPLGATFAVWGDWSKFKS